MKGIEDGAKQMLEPNIQQELMARHMAGATVTPIHPLEDLQKKSSFQSRG
jgi:hypothetical protein